MNTFIEKSKNFFCVPKGLSAYEVIFLFFSLILAYGFIEFGQSFAKLGIPISLPSSFGDIYNQTIKLFIFELYLVCVGLICLVHFFVQWRQKRFEFEKDKMLAGTLIVLAFGVLRLFVDLKMNPILGIRNSAFVWYLSLPVLICFSPIRIQTVEFFSRIIVFYLFYLFIFSFFKLWFDLYPGAQWSSAFGVYAPFALAFLVRSHFYSSLMLLVFGVSLGLNIYGKYQRTSLVGLMILLAFMLILSNSNIRLQNQIFKRICLLAMFFVLGIGAWSARLFYRDLQREIAYAEIQKKIGQEKLAMVEFEKKLKAENVNPEKIKALLETNRRNSEEAKLMAEKKKLAKQLGLKETSQEEIQMVKTDDARLITEGNISDTRFAQMGLGPSMGTLKDEKPKTLTTTAGFFSNVVSLSHLKKKLSGDNPFLKAKTNDYGLEIFRWGMWKDAFNLFLDKFFFGIGFQNDVVYRVYHGFGRYISSENWAKEKGAKIAGPHNSYLNGMARLGFVGIGIILLHLYALMRLYQYRYFGTLALLYAQMIYAMFNVGLEGPTRSFLLLLALGLALKIGQSKKMEVLPIPVRI